jgi:spermidine/putrescine ABC transporter ATP-binding subunit
VTDQPSASATSPGNTDLPIGESQHAPPTTAGTVLEIRSVAKRFGQREVLKSLSLGIAAGEFLTLLGESGSGKTTLLRLIAGFEQPSSGEIWMNGERLDSLPAYQRRVNTVFQHYALFPHLSVHENVAYGLRVTRVPRNEIASRVDDALRMVKMNEYAASRPAKLSGGQQQRVALARALVNRPLLLLLDEPLSALDANLRKQMQSELKSLQREVGITFLFVTHDQEEAMALSDRIALLRNGALEQVAAPREIYAQPATAYTAQFIGQTNLLQAEIRNGIASCGSLRWPAGGTGDGPEGFAMYSLRPEAIRLAADASGARLVRFRGNIRQQIYAGSTEWLEIDCAGTQALRARIPARGPLAGEQEFAFDAADAIRVKE